MNWFIATVLTLSVVTATAAEKIKFDFADAEITKMIDTYSKATGQKFVVDAGVRGKASIFLNEEVTADEAFNHLSSALAANGYAISKQGDTMIVKAARNIQRDYIEVSTELPSLKPERMAMWIYTFKNTSAEEVNRDLRIFPSRDGELNVYAKNNQVILTDWTSNLNRVALLLNEVDKPADAAVDKFTVSLKKDTAKPKAKKEKSKPAN